MAKRFRSREERRAARDQAVIDHLTQGPLKPRLDRKHGDAGTYDEKEGRKLDKAIHEEWTPERGGLPDF